MIHINLPDQVISSHDFERNVQSNFTTVLSLSQIQKMKDQAMKMLRQPIVSKLRCRDVGQITQSKMDREVWLLHAAACYIGSISGTF